MRLNVLEALQRSVFYVHTHEYCSKCYILNPLILYSLDAMNAIAQRSFDYIAFGINLVDRKFSLFLHKIVLSTLYHTNFSVFLNEFQGGDITALVRVHQLKKFFIFVVGFSIWKTTESVEKDQPNWLPSFSSADNSLWLYCFIVGSVHFTYFITIDRTDKLERKFVIPKCLRKISTGKKCFCTKIVLIVPRHRSHTKFFRFQN